MINEFPRVRFAPSPTGYLHVGGLRTALYNYLFAKSQNGKFILRIEDTDRNRYVEGAVENLINSLKWCGLDYDEGPDKEGGFGPYLQSQRLDIYQKYIQDDKEGGFGPYLQSQRLDIYQKYIKDLISSGKAYYCFCTPERLEALRLEQQKQKLPQAKYDKKCLNLSIQEVKENLEKRIPHVIRMNVKPNQIIQVMDIVRGKVEFDSNNVDDQVLIKSDGYPTYHLAHLVDDHLMKITHVIRGEEWLPSVPKHVLLYNFFNWEKPVFAHLPLLLNPDKSKLSKRQGDVAVEDYRSKGYLKEALVNFVTLLGWNAGDDVEFYNMPELIDKFSLENVNKAGAVFNIEKLNWLNAEHLRKKTNDEILSMLKDEIRKSKFEIQNYSDDYLLMVIEVMKERVSFVSEYLTKSHYFFESPKEYEQASVVKNWKPETPEQLTKLIESFILLENPVKEDFELALTKVTEELKVGKGKLIHPLRLALSGQSTGPGVFDIMFILGKEEVIKRIDSAINKIQS